MAAAMKPAMKRGGRSGSFLAVEHAVEGTLDD
jgi:hypothetical protein